MNKSPKYVSFTSVNRTLDDALGIYKQRIKDALEVFYKFKDDFKFRECPVCGDNENHEIDKFHGAYGIVKCNRCASIFINPCPTLGALEYYYNSCHCNEMLGSVYRKRLTSKNQIISDRVVSIVDIVKNLLNSNESDRPIKILEVGCSSGVFLAELKQGLIAEGLLERCFLLGVDIDEKAIERSIDTDLNLVAMPVEKFAQDNSDEFELVIHFELIEHLSDPFQFMLSINKLLKSSGVHYFHTPNALGMDNVALGWNSKRMLAHGIFPPMHINAFTTHNITHFALRTGFKIISIDTPGNLDVDIVKSMADELNEDSVFKSIINFTEEQLAVLQGWLQVLNASSHMRINLEKMT